MIPATWLGLVVALLPMAARAERTDLPSAAIVAAALDGSPTVEASRARIESARAAARALQVGPHQLLATSSYVRRSVVGTNGYNEFDATVQKGFRLPGKARLDRAAGELGIAVAENRSEDARHQAGLNLSTLWHDWLLATALLRNDIATIANYGAALHAVERREALRDASRLDVDLASSALALAQAQAAQSKTLIERAQLTLKASFPNIVLPPEAPVLSDPELPPEPLATLHDFVVSRSHEIGAAQKEAERLLTLARRARLDRYADPSVGVRLFSERGGQEKGAGLIASIGFGGAYRGAIAGQASSEANAAAIDLTQMQRTIAIVANTDVSDALTRLEAWQANKRAVDAASSAAVRTERGYRLGAIDLSDLLYAQRQANDARRAEINARAEAARAIFKLRIDSHTVWAPLNEAE